MNKKFFLVLLAIIFSLLMFSCKEETPTNPTEGDDGGNTKEPNRYGVLTKGNSKMLTTSEAASITSITSNSVTFSKDFGFEVGDVFTTPPVPGAPKGTIRKITGIKTAKVSGGTIFETIAGSFEELAEGGRIDLQGTVMNLSPKKYEKEILSGVNVETSFGAKADLIGYLDFTSEVEASLKFKFRGNLDFGLNFSARTQFSKEATFFNQDLGTLFLSGVSITPNVRLFVKVEGESSADVAFGTQAEFNYDGKVTYKNKWSFQQNSGKSFTLKPIEIKGEAGAKLIIGGEINFFIYDLFGPAFRAEGYLKLIANLSNNPQWRASYGMDLGVGVGPSWLLANFVSYKELWDNNLFDVEIASGNFDGGEENEGPIIEDILWFPETIVVGEEVIFTAVASDDKGVVSYLWDFDIDGVIERTSSSNQYDTTFSSLNTQTKTIQVKVFDEEGRWSARFKVFTINSSSGGGDQNEFTSFNPEWGETNVGRDEPFSWEFSNPENVISYDFVYSTSVPTGQYPWSTTSQSFDPFQQGSFGLDENTHYYWRVRAKLSDGSQVESEMLNFTTGDFGGTGEEKTLILQPGPEGEDVTLVHMVDKNSGEVFNFVEPNDASLGILRMERELPIEGENHLVSLEGESFIQFKEVSQLLSNVQIISAKLKLYASVYSELNFNLLGVNSPWAEQNITWNSRPSTSIISQHSITAGQGFVEIEISSIVESWIRSGNNYGLAFSLMQGEEGEIIFESSDSPSTPHRPLLEIVYTE